MSKVTEIYADRLVPLLKLNLSQLGKPVPDAVTLKAIAMDLIDKAEQKKVALTTSALSYIAFLYANVYAGAPAELAAALDRQREALLVTELVPLVRSQLAASDGDAADLDEKAVAIAGRLAAELVRQTS